MKADHLARLVALYPALAGGPATLQATIEAETSQTLAVPAGTRLFAEGTPCQGFPLLLSGTVRVARGSTGGRQLELYRVKAGELCVVSAAGIYGRAPLSAHGDAIEATELALLSPQGFDACCAHAPFRRFVFGVFADRLADLMMLAESVAFSRLDQRLAQALLGHGAQRRGTHQDLADELGTVREMVSRLLSRFAREGWVRLGRERVEVLDAAALRRLAGP